jgi:hypothetical protein
MAPLAVLAAEIRVGLVLHFDPEVLIQNGSTFSCGATERVTGAHFFACVARDARSKTGTWVPCFGETGTDRVQIPPQEKSGHPKWTAASTYYHPAQAWTVPDAAVEPAARAGKDASRQGARNLIKRPADVSAIIAKYRPSQVAAEEVAADATSVVAAPVSSPEGSKAK